MEMKFQYVLTAREGISSTGYMNLANRELGKLGLNSGEVGLVAVVNHLGYVFELTHNKKRDGFCGISGSGELGFGSSKAWLYPVGETQRTAEMLQKGIDFERDYHRHDANPHAIVYRKYEADFRRVAEALGLRPIKVSEKLF